MDKHVNLLILSHSIIFFRIFTKIISECMYIYTLMHEVKLSKQFFACHDWLNHIVKTGFLFFCCKIVIILREIEDSEIVTFVGENIWWRILFTYNRIAHLSIKKHWLPPSLTECEFHFVQIKSRVVKPTVMYISKNRGISQTIWGDNK